MRILPRLLSIVALAGSTACAAGAAGPAPAGTVSNAATADDSRPARRRTNIVTAEEIAAVRSSDGYDLVAQLRPNWLRTRGQVSMALAAPIRVYVNGSPLGTVATLRQLTSHSIRQMEFLGSSEATQRYGTDHANGAILVTLH